MIQLYNKGTTDFSRNGIALHPQKASVTFQDNGRFDLDLRMPVPDKINIDYGMILRVSVPRQEIPEIVLGTVSYWEVAAGQTNVELTSKGPVQKTVRYNEWVYGQVYHTGDKVSHSGRNYQAYREITDIDTTFPPDQYANAWREITRSYTDKGKVVATLDAGDVIMKTGDFNSEYMAAATLDGKQGYIQISKCTPQGNSEEIVIPAQTITAQSFTIMEIEKSTDEKTLSVHAEHVSYALGRCVLGDCSLVGVNPATAVLFIQGAMKEAYSGQIYTNLTDGTITADWSWKNAQNAILDPKAGLLQFTPGRMIRNDWNVFLVEKGAQIPAYSVTYGTNMLGVVWEGSVANLVTRIYPTAQNPDGSTLLLPEEKIDTVRTVPFIKPEVLNTKLKVGTKEKQSDGTEIELTEDIVFTRMREAANNRYNIDECDKPEITLELDWVHLPDTEEYQEYRLLRNAAPGEWVKVKNGPLGIDETIQMTGYTWDAVLEKYEKSTFGKNKVSPGVASYDIQNGAVTGRSIAAGAVGGQNLQAGAITAREIEANSITSDRIASKSIVSELIQAEAITAEEIAAGAVSAEKIQAGAVTADKIAAQAITSEKITAGAVTAAAIAAGAVTAQAIAAEAIVTEKLAAGAVEASKIAALAVTAEKLAAGAVTADKIGAGAITAAKISTDDLQAIQATLQIASIANAEIATADINFAHIKDLNAKSAYFGQTIFDEAVGGKLYVPRLAVGYAQMLGATISDLVIQATNDNFYKLDVDLAGNVTATQVTPSAAEIAQGYTNDGRTIYMGTDILATDLNTQNIYASHGLMDQITANIINVDKLFAREATISHINAMDLSSNTYIRSVVGDWQSQSTITQTVNSLSTRIDQLGYGTIFYSETEPDHNNLVVGDIWIEPVADNTWDDIAQYTWDELAALTWDQVAGRYRMYVWTGDKFKVLYDNLIVGDMQTQIEQNAYAITLKADASTVDILSGEVSDFAATLEVQARAITAAVESVALKNSNYRQATDPSLDPTITLNPGDTWTKAIGDGTWESLAAYTWDELSQFTWDELAGASVYTWTGTEWIQTGDYGATIHNRALIEESDRQISLLVTETVTLGDRISENRAAITIQANLIAQEVERATNAENGKISKTAQYQTADSIVSEAVSQSAQSAAGIYMAKTAQYQTPESIITEAVAQAATSASNTYIAKTQSLQTADAIKNEAVRLSGVAAAEAYIAKTNNYSNVDAILAEAQNQADAAAVSAKNASIAKTQTLQTADAIVSTAVAQAATAAAGAYIAKTNQYQTADAIVSTAETYAAGVASTAEANAKNASIAKTTNYTSINDIIAKAEQLATAAETNAKNASIARTQIYQSASAIVAAAESYTDNNAYGKVSGITITANGIDISGSQYVQIASGGYFRVTSGNFGIKSDAAASEYVIWSGASTAAASQFRVKKDGSVYLTKLISLDQQGRESEVNLRTTSLWKLGYQTVKQTTITTDSGGYCTSFELSDGTVLNFKSAASVDFDTESLWISGEKTLTLTNGKSRTVTIPDPAASDWSGSYVGSNREAVTVMIAGKAFNGLIDVSDAYAAGAAGVDFQSQSGWASGENTITLTNGKKDKVYMPSTSSAQWSAYWVGTNNVSVTAIIGGRSYTAHFTN